MIDLAKLTLKEVQELVESTVDGRAVRIYANDGRPDYPIHGAREFAGVWSLDAWDRFGLLQTGLPEMDDNLKLKPKTIDWSKMPVDTRVEFNGSIMYLASPPAYPGSVRLFRTGSNSLTTNGDSINVSCTEIKLIKGRRVVWEGGQCPLPDGVEIEVSFRDETRIVCNCTGIGHKRWEQRMGDGDIIWYQITGRIV